MTDFADIKKTLHRIYVKDAADTARATFFLHFPTKDALLAEYEREHVESLTKALDRMAVERDTLQDRVKDLSRQLEEHEKETQSWKDKYDELMLRFLRQNAQLKEINQILPKFNEMLKKALS